MPKSTQTPPRYIAIFDLGKTHAKMILADLGTQREIDSRTQPNTVLSGPPYPHFDVDGLKSFLLTSLAAFQANTPLDAIFVTTHGACCALIDHDGLVLPVLDYEHPGPNETSESYARNRPDDIRTGSPRLPGGLNIGAQLHWLQARFPDAYAQAETLLFWPQYWSWWLTGKTASEISFATCHADLCDLNTKEMIADPTLIADLMPPLQYGGDVLGALRPDLAQQINAHHDIQVYVGAHDSSLALESARGTRSGPVTILSTGTWVTAFVLGVDKMPEQINDRVMASCDMQGVLVPNFRFMGGQAFQDILTAPPRAGNIDWSPHEVDVTKPADEARFALTLKKDGTQVALPRGQQEQQDRLVSQVIAELTCEGLQDIGADGPILISGPFAGNDAYCDLIAERRGAEIHKTLGATGVVQAVADLLRTRTNPQEVRTP